MEYLTSAPGDFATTSISDWIAETSDTLSYLDDGNYQFTIKSRYDVGFEEVGGDSILFTIDAVTGPGLRFYPLYQAISSGSNVDIYLYVEDILDLTGMELHLSYSPATLQIMAVNPANMLLGSTIFYKDMEYGAGMTRIIASGEDFTGINGTGAIAQLKFMSVDPGLAFISILETPGATQLRDSQNDTLHYVVKNGLIEVN